MIRKHIIKHLVLYSFLLAAIIALIIMLPFLVTPIYGSGSLFEIMNDILLLVSLLALFVIHPVLLTILNLFFLFQKTTDSERIRRGKHIEYLTILLGVLYTVPVLIFYEIQLQADWTETLYDNQAHTPIWTQAYATIIVTSLTGIAGYVLLSVKKLNKMPPLVIVTAMGAMYIGMIQCALWTAQLFSAEYFFLYLFPVNCILIAAKTIRYKVLEWNTQEEREPREFHNRVLNHINRKLMRSAAWPLAAFLIMWPLLGIIICILLLFGQRPDSIIKAWTETSDWNLSQRVAPQNIHYDDHYLCTVAAGGHKKVVKPIRLGVRHGHSVIVNRQLCIANAFEQVLEERLPAIHRPIRQFYDKYGFPLAKMIHSPYAADFVYYIMKPLEWLFLAVLYFTDAAPENRIAVQYLPKNTICKTPAGS